MTGKSMPSLRLRPAAPGRGPVSQEDVCAASPPAGLRMGSQPLGLDLSRAPSAGAAAPTGSVWPISLSPELPGRWPLSAAGLSQPSRWWTVLTSLGTSPSLSLWAPRRGQRLLWHRPSHASSGSPAPTSTAPPCALPQERPHHAPQTECEALRSTRVPWLRPLGTPAPTRASLRGPCPTLPEATLGVPPVAMTPAPAFVVDATTVRGPRRWTGRSARCSHGLSVPGRGTNGGSGEPGVGGNVTAVRGRD